ncbi:MAG: bifunctional precorrin-2 dehydrogenase/sirohydrochlorin ferrochelatase [Planctomycetes bacterium]|nr:bifunctional precorrin-2 dehydrogenase/sirohydrochlorin ferrochelatase [Planctomycetota bacterium]
MSARRRSDLYPVFLDLHGLPVLVVGGGAVAQRKVLGLRRSGARITIVSKRFTPELARMQEIRRVRRGFRESDLREACLVFAATDDPGLNARIAALALERAVWTNVAAPPDAGNLWVPASFRRGSLCVAISTGGASAAAAKALRRELERTLASSWADFLGLLEARRGRVVATVSDPRRRRRLLKELGRADWAVRIRRKGAASVARAMDRLIERARNGRGTKRRR